MWKAADVKYILTKYGVMVHERKGYDTMKIIDRFTPCYQKRIIPVSDRIHYEVLGFWIS